MTYEVNNDTAKQCRDELTALAQVQDHFAAILSLLADRPDLDDLRGALQEFGEMCAVAVREREQAYDAYCNPPQYEPGYSRLTFGFNGRRR